MSLASPAIPSLHPLPWLPTFRTADRPMPLLSRKERNLSYRHRSRHLSFRGFPKARKNRIPLQAAVEGSGRSSTRARKPNSCSLQESRSRSATSSTPSSNPDSVLQSLSPPASVLPSLSPSLLPWRRSRPPRTDRCTRQSRRFHTRCH